MSPKNKIYEHIGDELVNKIKHLSKALNSAQNIILSLEKENERLANLLAQISEPDDNYWDMGNISKTMELINS